MTKEHVILLYSHIVRIWLLPTLYSVVDPDVEPNFEPEAEEIYPNMCYSTRWQGDAPNGYSPHLGPMSTWYAGNLGRLHFDILSQEGDDLRVLCFLMEEKDLDEEHPPIILATSFGIEPRQVSQDNYRLCNGHMVTFFAGYESTATLHIWPMNESPEAYLTTRLRDARLESNFSSFCPISGRMCHVLGNKTIVVLDYHPLPSMTSSSVFSVSRFHND